MDLHQVSFREKEPRKGSGEKTRTLLLSTPLVNFTKASPRFTTQQPCNGRTYFHPPPCELSEDIRTCSPPSRLKSTVTLPKSVCSPSATARSFRGCGGDLTQRTWSPLSASRRWRDSSVPCGRPRFAFRMPRITVTISWELVMNFAIVARVSAARRMEGWGRGEEEWWRMSSLEMFQNSTRSRVPFESMTPAP